MKKVNPTFIFWTFFTLVILLGLRIDLMDVDAAQYASISKEMLDKMSFLQIYDLNRDYLDKPPLLFWLSAISMSIFGKTDWAFRLPSILGIAVAIYATYRVALLHYSKAIATRAAIILATTQSIFLITHDCRTDSLLMCFVTVSIWQLAEAFQYNRISNWLGAFTAIAAALMTKGPIGLVIPAFAFIGQTIYTKNYSNFFKKQYIWGVLWIGILLIPMCIGLYNQFDLHPEKVLYGRQNTSGLRFFFWTQSFGRVTGESVWRENGEFFFLLQNMLWSFAPWILFALAAIVFHIKQTLQRKSVEAIHISAFLLTYLALAQSNYQLPHYIFVVFPSLSILTANFLNTIEEKYNNTLLSVTALIALGILFVCSWLHIIAFPMNIEMIFAMLCSGGVLAWAVFQLQWKTYFKILVLIALIANTFLSGWIYPNLLNYQEGSQVGHLVQQSGRTATDFFLLDKEVSHSLAFYSGFIPTTIHEPKQLHVQNWVLTTSDGIKKLQSAGYEYKILMNGIGTSVTNLSTSFLNKETRNSNGTIYWLVEITKIQDWG